MSVRATTAAEAAAVGRALAAATRAAAVQRKQLKERIQTFARLVFEKKAEANKHQWHPLHGSDETGVPEGHFDGLIAIFNRLLIGEVGEDSFTKAVTPLTTSNQLGAASRTSSDYSMRWYTVPRRVTGDHNEETVYIMPYHNRTVYKLKVPYHTLVLRDFTKQHVLAEVRYQLQVNNQNNDDLAFLTPTIRAWSQPTSRSRSSDASRFCSRSTKPSNRARPQKKRARTAAAATPRRHWTAALTPPWRRPPRRRRSSSSAKKSMM
jgi:hypothetical protein